MILFCAHKIALHRKTQDEWQVMENVVQPSQHDIFALPMSEKAPKIDPLPLKIPLEPRQSLYIPL